MNFRKKIVLSHHNYLFYIDQFVRLNMNFYKYRIRIQCLIKPEVEMKCENQIFQIKSLEGKPIFLYNSITSNREYRSSVFEIIVDECFILEVVPEHTTQYGWCFINIVEDKNLSEIDKLDTKETTLLFDLIDRCNLHCVSCYHGIYGGSGQKMGKDTLKSIVEHGVKYLNVSRISPYNWSEPFLCNNINEFVDIIAEKTEVPIALSTNLNVTPDYLKLVRMLPKVDGIAFSVSGLTNDIYTKYHKGGDIQQVNKNLNLFLQAREESNAKTTFVLRYGRNIYNREQEQEMQEFCLKRNIKFIPMRYCLTDMQLVKKVADGGRLPERTYDTLYHSFEELYSDIIDNLSPYCCPLLTDDIVTDCNGKLMLCCATKIVLDKNLTDVYSIGEMVETRLQNNFCRECYQKGYYGYLAGVKRLHQNLCERV